MKKVLLVTLQGNHNYGNRLQNYALRQAIGKLGYCVDNLTVNAEAIDRKTLKSRLLKDRFWVLIRRPGFTEHCAKMQRLYACLRFSERYAPRMYFSSDQVWQKDWSEYAFGVTGSDQVWHNWHHAYMERELEYYYLQFLPKEKRVSYAPSFGFTSFPEEDLPMHWEGLMGMAALSCREAEGSTLIRELTGRQAIKVLDPVFLLDPQEWSGIEKKPRFKIKKPYLLQFFLGTVTGEYRKEIDRIRTERGLEVLNINDPAEPKHYGISPTEFLWLIHNAEAVCTDSFHASAFSVIFGVGLRAFPRVQERMTDMFGRIRDLLTPIGLTDLAFGESRDGKLSTALSQEARSFLDAEREKSMLYLKQYLKDD